MTATRTGTQAIDRAAELLVRVVESHEAPSVGELAEASGLPKSTTSRLVSALERQGLVQRDTGRAALLPGPVLLRYAAKERTDPDLIELASDALDRLAEVTGETINLGVATTGVVEQLDQRDSRHYLGSTNWVGKRVPLHASAIGKVFMAFGDIPVPTGPLERLAPKTLVDVDELASDLVITRNHGLRVGGRRARAGPVGDRRTRLRCRRHSHRRPLGVRSHRSLQARARRRGRPRALSRGGNAFHPARIRKHHERRRMTDEDIDLRSLSDDELTSQMHDDLYDGLADEILEGTNILLERGWAADKVLNDALVEGMRIVGIDFRDGILFVPEVLLAANAMKTGMNILRPLLAETGAERMGTVVIGTVKGDIHDIGKNLVAMMLEGAGFEVIDLGINNPVEKYLAAIEEHKPDILGMSALLTTTMPYMKVVIDTMIEQGIRDDYIVLVGGAPLNEEFGKAVGADAYCRDAAIAAETAQALVLARRAAARSN